MSFKTLIAWLWGEFKEMLPAAIFFLVTFHMIDITKVVILETYNMTAASASAATITALLVAKAILVVDNLPVSSHFNSVVWHNVLWRIFLFYLVTLFFHVLEGLFGYYLKSDEPFNLINVFEWVSWSHFAVIQMWLIVLITLFTAVRETARLIGHDKLMRLLTEKVKV